MMTCANSVLAAAAEQSQASNVTTVVAVTTSACSKFTAPARCKAQVDACLADSGCVKVQSCLATCHCGDTMCTIGCVRRAEGSPIVLEMMTCASSDLAGVAEQSQASYVTTVAVGAATGAAL